MAGPESVRGDRLPQQPEQHHQGERRRVSATPVLHGRPQQAEDAKFGRHTAVGPAARPRQSGRVQERVRRVEELVVREAERREQEGHQERGRRPRLDQFVAQNVGRRREGAGHGGPVEFVLVRGERT